MAERRLHCLQRVLGVKYSPQSIAGRLIVQEARELRAHAIVLALAPRTGTTLFGKTVEAVLADRPCRVIIESDPADA